MDRSTAALTAQKIGNLLPGPIGFIDPLPHKTVKRGMGPIDNARHKPMTYRIDMYVNHICGVVLFVADRMLPKASLLDTALSFGKTHR